MYMRITRLLIEDFVTESQGHPIFDVRSPAEYAHAYIPSANNLPLFTNEERKVVGTAYKQESKERAIKIGLEYFGPKMVKMIEEAEQVVKAYAAKKKNPDSEKTIFVYCWRGGMRSAGVAWLLDLYGFKVYTLVGGYKAYRSWVLKQFEKEYPISIIGGYTGSGKTETLHRLQTMKEAVLDLEGIASHKGSAFGNLGQPIQPKQEMFENLLATRLYELTVLQQAEHIWTEDESQRIGEVNIPIRFYSFLRTRNLYFMDLPFEERLNYIVEHYGQFEKEKLINATIRIQKRLGGLETKTAVNCLLENDVKGAFTILLKYYDKFYNKSMHNQRGHVELLMQKIVMQKVNPAANAEQVKKIHKSRIISSASL